MPDDDRAQEVRRVARAHAGQAGPLLPVLHAVQQALGCITTPDVRVVADVLNLSVADVHGVVSFYDDFRSTEPPAHTVRICRGEACQSVGAGALFDEAVARHAGRPGVEVRQVFCLGLCAVGPSGEVDGVLHGRLDAGSLAELTEGWRP